MKKIITVVGLCLILVSGLNAKGIKRSRRYLFELGPKANLYIGDEVRIGIGAEVVVNPLSTFGLRMELTELVVGGNTSFYLNNNGSIDALIPIPMRNLAPYIHAGFGFNVFDTGAGSQTIFSIRAGMGIDYPISPGTKLFFEPGIIISGNGDTKATFRLSFGGRFGVLR